MKRTTFAFLLAAALALPSVVWTQRPPARPKLILVLSIDQMRYDYLTRLGPLFKGGLKTLRDRGAVFSNAHYRHSASETGPGHSVILTGRHPSHSGIVANEWWDPYLRRAMNVVDDPVQTAVGGPGRGASPVNALSFTIGDVLKQQTPRSMVVGVSLKDRSAVLMAGRRADAAFWYEVDGGNFVSSTYYMRELPAWLTKLNAQRIPDTFAGKSWTRLLPDESVYDKYAGKDAIEGEWDRRDIVFPHAIRSSPPNRLFYDDLRRTPFADEMTLGVALEAMKAYRLGDDVDPDILAVSFSATDIIGHTYGPDSHEAMDQLLRLDLVLEKLFKAVDDRAGVGNTLVVLTADHGAMPLVEVLRAQGIDARRVPPATLLAAVGAALDKRFPGVQGLIPYTSGDIYFDENVIRQRGLNRKDVEDTAIAALMATGLVDKVYTRADLRGAPPASDPFFTLFQNAFYEPRSPDLNILLKKYLYLDSRPGGTGHGTAHEYDRHVPIVFMGPGVKAGTYDAACGPEDIAPTLATMLGLRFPRESDSRLLTEILP